METPANGLVKENVGQNQGFRPESVPNMKEVEYLG